MAVSAPLNDEARAMLERVARVGYVDLSIPLSEIRQARDHCDPELKGDFVYDGSREEKQVPSEDSGVTYTVPVTILKPSRGGSLTWNNIMVYFHGGGWVWGSRKSHMKICEIISDLCQCVVVNVEYRLSPEHKFPACYVDAEAVVRWALANKREIANNSSAIVGVAGDSAGGNIAASICHIVRTLDYQILIYPALTLNNYRNYPSFERYSKELLLTDELCDWFHNHFLNNDEEAQDPLCSPMNRPRESFKGIPPALFILSQCDLLADQSPEYRAMIDANGGYSENQYLIGALHGCISSPGFYKETLKPMMEIIPSFFTTIAKLKK